MAGTCGRYARQICPPIATSRSEQRDAGGRRRDRGGGVQGEGEGSPRQHAEEYRPEAAGHRRKAREADPKKSIRECAAELGTSDKTLNDWVIEFGRTGKAAQARADEQKEPDEARRRIGEPGSGSGFLKEAAAFFARSL